ncbi:MAG: aminoglycoside phosphotransferase family protein [Acidimicrobiales bacterium]
MVIEVSSSLRKARIAAGESLWLDTLPELVSEMASHWSLAIGHSCDGFGMNALVVEATTADGSAVVLKLAPPSDAEKLVLEATVLRLADGHGCVRVLHADRDRRALLLERLGPSMYDLGLPRRQRHELLLDAVKQMWRPVDPSVRLQRGSERARWTIERLEQVWEQSDRACSESVLADAIACAERRADAHDDTRAVLCHGDLHELNALQAEDGTFRLIDPEGVMAEPEYDLGVLMRNAPGEDDLHERADWLAAATGCDRTAIWEWGTAERVLSGLWCRVVDHQPHGDKQLADAERLSP